MKLILRKFGDVRLIAITAFDKKKTGGEGHTTLTAAQA